jgi:hypothetical protein
LGYKGSLPAERRKSEEIAKESYRILRVIIEERTWMPDA